MHHIKSEPQSSEPLKIGAGLEQEMRRERIGAGFAVAPLFSESPPAAVPTPDVCF